MEKQEKSQTAQNIAMLRDKSVLKQNVYDNTKSAFKIMKRLMLDIVNEYNTQLADEDERIRLEYRDRGMFEAELKVAGDLLIFNMHTNIFEFPRNHEIWKDDFFVERPLMTYSGIINIYNFLADSFRYNRLDDLGYLVGRIFINKDSSFFVEGKHELGFGYHSFGQYMVTEENMRALIESTIYYALKFDLLVPPFSAIDVVSVNYMKEKINKHKMQTGKRLGFQYSYED